MPINAPWRPYASGDLLYGLAGPRGEFAIFLGADAHCTIDQYEIATVDRAHAGIRHDPDFIAALNVHAKYRSVVEYADVGWDLSNAQQWAYGTVAMASLARRKCKGGLNWITHFTNLHIHFCLEGLDITAAASKNYAGIGGIQDGPVGKAPVDMAAEVKARSITGAELRWVYRNRNDPQVRNQVQFWKRKFSWVNGVRTLDGFEACTPPWSVGWTPAIRGAWAAYVPTTVWAP